MNRFRVLITDPLPETGLFPLLDDGRFDVLREGPPANGANGSSGANGNNGAHGNGGPRSRLARALEDADGVIIRSATRISGSDLRDVSRLRVIGRAGVGVDNIDVDAATRKGIAVFNATSGNVVSTAELTFALMLSLSRQVPRADRSMRKGEWNRAGHQGIELYGRTLGLVGAGRIGAAVAARARAFGMNVAVCDPYLDPDRARAMKVEPEPLERVLATADFVSLHVPLTDATRGMIGRDQLSFMKPTAYLVNAARGPVVDHPALVAALRSNRIAGAALDVYAEEPPPADDPLRSLDNVVLTPHLGASTGEARQKIATEIAEGVRAYLLEGDSSHAVNGPELLQRHGR